MKRPRGTLNREPRQEDGGVAVYGRREFVCLDGGRTRTDRPVVAADRGRQPMPGRARALRDALRERFPTEQDFTAWNDAQSARDPRLALQPQQIFVDIERAHVPTLHHAYALAAATGWTFERVCLAFGIDFAALPRVHTALGADRTHVDLTGYGFNGSLVMPTDLAPGITRSTTPLTDLVFGWARQPGGAWAGTEHRLTGQIGKADNLAYPRLPSGAIILIDPSVTAATDQNRYYLVQHPNGFSCARTTVEHGTLSLLSEDRNRYPRLDFALKDVRVLGHVVAFGGRIDRLQPPAPVNLGDLVDIRRPLIDAERIRDMSSPAMLRDIWARRGLTFSQFQRKVRVLRRLAGARFTIGRGHMHDLMQADAAAQDSVPHLDTVFALAAIFLLNPKDLLRGYNLPVDEQPLRAGDDAAAAERARQLADRLRAHPMVAYLLQRGWDLPWLLSLYRGASLASRLFYMADISAGLTPLLKPDAFVSVNVKQRRIVSTVKDRPVDTLRDWERPIYLLQTNSRHKFIAGYCEMRGDTITVVPHPDAPSQRALRFRCPDQAIVVGRITHVTTLME